MKGSVTAGHPEAHSTSNNGSGSLSYPGLRLRCPCCAIDLSGVECPRCAHRFETSAGIVRALTPERMAHYARFIAEYERIRAAEGRGSENAQFYCELPYRDLSGMNVTQWRIRARSWNHLLRQVLQPNLPQHARILDLGAGNCWLSFRLAQAGYSPVAVDLLVNDRDGLGAAKHYRGLLTTMFPRFQAELMRLPLQSGQFDAVVFNASFHYAEDAETVFREALRCTRPGGLVVICDTPWYSEIGRAHV